MDIARGFTVEGAHGFELGVCIDAIIFMAGMNAFYA
jgi:hypothetical protein